VSRRPFEDTCGAGQSVRFVSTNFYQLLDINHKMLYNKASWSGGQPDTVKQTDKERGLKMEITFGKFRGWQTMDLAKAGQVGRDYLSWGAENLRSPKWRKEFQDALDATQEIDVRLTANAIMIDAPDLPCDDADIIARDEKALNEAANRAQAQYDAAKTWLHEAFVGLGVDEKVSRRLVALAVEDGMPGIDRVVTFRSVPRVDIARAVEQFEARCALIEW